MVVTDRFNGNTSPAEVVRCQCFPKSVSNQMFAYPTIMVVYSSTTRMVAVLDCFRSSGPLEFLR